LIWQTFLLNTLPGSNEATCSTQVPAWELLHLSGAKSRCWLCQSLHLCKRRWNPVLFKPAQGIREGGFPVQARLAGRETPAQENPFSTASSRLLSCPLGKGD